MRSWSVTLAVIALLCSLSSAEAQILGMVADDLTNEVSVFDADTDTVLATISIPALPIPIPFPPFFLDPTIGDCAMLADQSLGFVTTFTGEVFVIDLVALSLVDVDPIAPGIQGISICNAGEDLAITRDQEFLLTVNGGGALTTVSVVDIATLSEVWCEVLPDGANAVDVCPDGSVLVASGTPPGVHRYTLSGTGVLTDTLDYLDLSAFDADVNVYCHPSGSFGVAVTANSVAPEGTITSFAIPGLGEVDALSLPHEVGLHGFFNFIGDGFWVRSQEFLGPGHVELYGYSAGLFTGPMASTPIGEATDQFFGMDQGAIHPDETKIYISDASGVEIFDPVSLVSLGFLGSLSGEMSGICFGTPDESGPLAVDLLSFRGKETNFGSVQLTWETASETDSAGFNLYREPWSPNFSDDMGVGAVQVNRTLIPAQGSQFHGATYEFSVLKLPHQRPARYWLEEIDIFGNRQLERPIFARPAAPHTPPVR